MFPDDDNIDTLIGANELTSDVDPSDFSFYVKSCVLYLNDTECSSLSRDCDDIDNAPTHYINFMKVHSCLRKLAPPKKVTTLGVQALVAYLLFHSCSSCFSFYRLLGI